MSAGVKPDLVRALGATYHTGAVADACPDPDVIIECTGVSALVLDAMSHVGTGGVVCLTGVSLGRPHHRGRRGRAQPQHGAGERGRGGIGQRQPAPLRGGGRRAGQGRPRLAGPAGQPARSRSAQWEEALTRQPDDVKVVIEVNPE